MLEKELAALKAGREFLPDGLLNHARAGKADQGSRLANVQIAQHGERGGHAARGRVGQHGDIGHAGFVQTRQGGRNLGQLHQADNAFHHACPAGGGDNDQRIPGLNGFFDGAGNFLAYDRAHAAADECVFHRAHNHGAPVQLAAGIDHRVLQAGIGLGLFQARRVGLEIHEFQRVGRNQIRVEYLVLSAVEELRQPGAGVNAEVLLALRTNVEVLLEILLPDDLAAVLTLHPQPLGAHLLLA